MNAILCACLCFLNPLVPLDSIVAVAVSVGILLFRDNRTLTADHLAVCAAWHRRCWEEARVPVVPVTPLAWGQGRWGGRAAPAAVVPPAPWSVHTTARDDHRRPSHRCAPAATPDTREVTRPHRGAPRVAAGRPAVYAMEEAVGIIAQHRRRSMAGQAQAYVMPSRVATVGTLIRRQQAWDRWHLRVGDAQ